MEISQIKNQVLIILADEQGFDLDTCLLENIRERLHILACPNQLTHAALQVVIEDFGEQHFKYHC